MSKSSKRTKKKKLSRLTPEKFAEQVVKARGLYDEGKIEEAIDLLKATLKASPTSYTNIEKSEVWELLGDLYVELKEYKKADIFYRYHLRHAKESDRKREVTLKQVEVYWQIGKLRQLLNLLEGLREADGLRSITPITCHLYSTWAD